MRDKSRPVLSFDGKGINGPDEHRSRVATFTNRENAERWGNLFAAAPDLLAVCRELVFRFEHCDDPADAEVIDNARAAIAKARGEGGAA